MTRETEIKKSICVGCKGECGVLVHVENDHVVKATEDPDWPIKVWPRTAACTRLRAAKEWFYHPQRLNFPLKRVGGRGEGKWQRLTWDQAFDEMAEKLLKIIEKYGLETLCYTAGGCLNYQKPNHPCTVSGNQTATSYWPMTPISVIPSRVPSP